jgi:hypothetical protein
MHHFFEGLLESLKIPLLSSSLNILIFYINILLMHTHRYRSSSRRFHNLGFFSLTVFSMYQTYLTGILQKSISYI